jgi:peptide alpha-N-acetyltransferase
MHACMRAPPSHHFLPRYFLQQWPKLCYLAHDGEKAFGTVICKLDQHRTKMMRGYVAMLVVDKAYRGKGAGMAECPSGVLPWRH